MYCFIVCWNIVWCICRTDVFIYVVSPGLYVMDANAAIALITANKLTWSTYSIIAVKVSACCQHRSCCTSISSYFSSFAIHSKRIAKYLLLRAILSGACRVQISAWQLIGLRRTIHHLKLIHASDWSNCDRSFSLYVCCNDVATLRTF